MKKISFLIILISLFLGSWCLAQNLPGGFEKNDKAQWISYSRELPASDSLFYLDNSAPLFRKDFSLKSKIEKATLFITAAGYYKATLNSDPVGKNELDPGWTDFSKRIYYSTYDVTSLVTSGNNCLGVSLLSLIHI
jgi:alpha-L-rhamnosidase